MTSPFVACVYKKMKHQGRIYYSRSTEEGVLIEKKGEKSHCTKRFSAGA